MKNREPELITRPGQDVLTRDGKHSGASLPPRDARRGSVMVEFAVTFPLLILAVSGVFQFGHMFFLYNNLQSAVRAGARYASVADYDTPNGSEFEQLVEDLVLYRTTTPDGSDDPVVPGLTAGNIVVDVNKDGNGFPISVTVYISNFTVPAVWDDFTLVDKPRSTFIYQGQVR